jgi:hypothetical protein
MRALASAGATPSAARLERPAASPIATANSHQPAQTHRVRVSCSRWAASTAIAPSTVASAAVRSTVTRIRSVYGIAAR